MRVRAQLYKQRRCVLIKKVRGAVFQIQKFTLFAALSLSRYRVVIYILSKC